MSNVVVLPLMSKNNRHFKFSKTQEIKDLLNEIYLLYDSLNIQPFNLVFEYETLSSCSIDGLNTTIPDTLRLLKKGRASKKKEQTVLNTLNILKNNVLDNIRIDKEGVIHLWRCLTYKALSNDLGGFNSKGYRSVSSMVSNKKRKIVHIPPSSKYVDSMMDNLYRFNCLFEEDIILKAIIFHFYFVYVHPFCDGNGRTSRILLNKILVDAGLSKFKYISITSEVKKSVIEYERMLLRSEIDEDNNLTDFIIFYLRKIRSVVSNLSDGVYLRGVSSDVERSLVLKVIENYLRASHFSYTKTEIYNTLNTNGMRVSKKDVDKIVEEGLKLNILTINQEMKRIRYKYNYNYNYNRGSKYE